MAGLRLLLWPFVVIILGELASPYPNLSWHATRFVVRALASNENRRSRASQQAQRVSCQWGFFVSLVRFFHGALKLTIMRIILKLTIVIINKRDNVTG